VRLEIPFKGQTAVQVFNGTAGWKLRPYLNRLEVESFTADELKLASMQAELDGPLVDYAAKGTHIDLVGTEKVEDRDTYKLKLTLSNGQETHVWIDAQTFLEAKIEGQPRLLDGVEHQVEVYYRDYRMVSGLQIPFVLETRVLPLASASATRIRETPVRPEKIVIEKVEINPKLDASLFSKPQIETASNVH
jgi:outer membrane lipoprotein-sorting protein